MSVELPPSGETAGRPLPVIDELVLHRLGQRLTYYDVEQTVYGGEGGSRTSPLTWVAQKAVTGREGDNDAYYDHEHVGEAHRTVALISKSLEEVAGQSVGDAEVTAPHLDYVLISRFGFERPGVAELFERYTAHEQPHLWELINDREACSRLGIARDAAIAAYGYYSLTVHWARGEHDEPAAINGGEAEALASRQDPSDAGVVIDASSRFRRPVPEAPGPSSEVVAIIDSSESQARQSLEQLERATEGIMSIFNMLGVWLEGQPKKDVREVMAPYAKALIQIDEARRAILNAIESAEQAKRP